MKCSSRLNETPNPTSERHGTRELGFSLPSSGGAGRGEEALDIPNTAVCWQSLILCGRRHKEKLNPPIDFTATAVDQSLLTPTATRFA
jgi:hypothetical protein